MTDTIKTWYERNYIVNDGDSRHEAMQAEIDELRAAIAQQAEQGWQPIETAPKDFMTSFDGWCGERVAGITWAHPDYSAKGHYAFCISEYEHDFWHVTEVKGLTHWMPLPSPPKETTCKQKP